MGVTCLVMVVLTNLGHNGSITVMAKQYNVAEAKAHLSDLLARVEGGQEVMIARAGRPVARLVAVEEPNRRVFPTYPEYDIPDEILDAPLPEDELALWE